MVSAKMVCRSGHIMLFTHYQQKTFQHSFAFTLINLLKKKTCVKQSTAAKAIFSDIRIVTK